MGWFVAALLAGFFFASSRLVSRFILRKKGDPLSYTALHDLIAGLILMPFFFFDFGLPSKNISWLFFGITFLFLFLCDFFTFKCLKYMDISLFQIIIQLRHIFVLFGGFFLYFETITIFKVIAILLITSGASFSLYQKAKFHWSKGAFFAVLQALFGSTAFLASKTALQDFSQTTFASFGLIAIGLLSFTSMKLNTKKIFYEFKLNSWKLIIAATLFGFFELFQFIAIKLGEVSRVIPVIQVSLVFVVVGGIILLKEHERIPQKLLGMLLIIAGIIVMNFL
jgi:drug/metabolite transporter (DMT)-like permease